LAQSDSSRIASLKLLQQIVEHVPIRVFWKDTELRYLGCNTAFASDAGHQKPEDLIGKDDFEMAWREQAELYRADDFKVMASGQPKLDYEEPQTTADGRTIWLRTSKVPLRSSDGEVIGILGIYEDITARKLAEETLNNSERDLREAQRLAESGSWRLELASNKVTWSPEMYRMFGLDPDQPPPDLPEFARLLTPESWILMNRAFSTLINEGKPYEIELESIGHDGKQSHILSRGEAVRDTSGAIVGIRGVSANITRRKQAETELRRSRELLSKIVESLPIRVFWKDTELRYLGCNTAFARDAGHQTPEDLIGKDDFEMAWREQAELYREDDLRIMASGQPRLGFEEPSTGADGRTTWLRTSKVPLQDAAGQTVGMLGIYEDITTQKEAHDALLHSRQTLNDAEHIASLGSWELDLKARTLTWSDTVYDIFEADPAQLKPSYERFLDAIHPDDREAVDRTFHDSVRNKSPYDIVHRLRMDDGRIKFVHERGHTVYGNDGEPVRSVGTIQDITEYQQARIALSNSNRALRAISACNEALFRSGSEAELINAISTLIVEVGGYRMAWIGYVEHDAAKTIRPVAKYGYEAGYLDGRHFSWDAHSEFGRGPSGNAVRSGQPQAHPDLLDIPQLANWRDSARQRGYHSIIALPIKGGSTTIGVLVIYAQERDAFSAEEIALLQDLAGDLAYGIQTLRTRTERDRIAAEHEQQTLTLQKSLEDFIRAIASTVEMRDPYTAGHQQRTSLLAVAIAREMQLPEDRVHGLELAAIVHDLGKINVPAEILSKPGKLSDMEHQIIKVHPQTGYDILKDIRFPWPIATIVWQHHERMDGTGYPQGLKGDQILLESRIMAVADVIEAMASHRPYRPSRGVEVALQELERGRGSIYDPAVVDAGLRLFREKHYTLPV
jgi:PAS domain S-box-containing protein